MKLNEQDSIALASLLLSQDMQREMNRNLFLSPAFNNPDSVDFANARNYIFVNLVDIVAGKNIEEANKWLPTIVALMGMSDNSYKGFLFAL